METIPHIMEKMIEEEVESYTLPLPLPLEDVLRMMQPHLVQIRDFAQFRLDFAKLQADYNAIIAELTEAKSAMIEEQLVSIQDRLDVISEPIKNYNCVIGAWGQIEARAQYEMIEKFCWETGLEIPYHAAFQKERKDRILSQIIANQKECRTIYYCQSPYYQLGLAYGQRETDRLVEEMVQEGLLIRAEDGSVYLSNWENYLYHFDS